MNTIIRSLLFILISLPGVTEVHHISAQQTSPVPTARQKLDQMEISFTQETFLEHCQDGREDVVNLFLAAGMNPDTEGNEGLTALIAATIEGHDHITGLLIEAGADVNKTDMHGATALMYAASQGHTDQVRQLTEAGADINVFDSHNGCTALMYAAYDGYSEIIQILIETGADLNLKDSQTGYTALMYAAFQGYLDATRVLVEEGADVHATSTLGKTAQTLAADRGFRRVSRLLSRANTP